MFWSVYKELYAESVEVRSKRDSDHPANVRRVLDRFTRYCGVAGRKLEEILSMDLEHYIALRKKDSNPHSGKPLENRTLNNEIEILVAAFGKAGPKETRGPGRRNYGFITDVPYVEKLDEARRIATVVEPEQIARFIEASASAKSPCPAVCDPALFWQDTLLLELVTRLRRSALLRIVRPDDDTLLRKMQIHLPPELSKTNQEQVIALGSGPTGRQVVEMLAKLPTKPGEFFLPWKRKNGKPMSLGHFSNTFSAVQRAAGISEGERFRLKDVRSTAGSLIARRFTESVAKTALGHSPNTNTLHTNYFNAEPRDEDREASNMMASLAMPYLAPEVDEPPPSHPPTVRFTRRLG